jgi:TMEM199 family protein
MSRRLQELHVFELESTDPSQSDEYKQLMARLRREEEERSYERMLKAPTTRETFAQRFPSAPAAMSLADSFAEANRPTRPEDLGSDEITHGEIQKQVTLIINFLISIVGCAAAIWMVSRWWSTTARLLLTLTGSIVVAICEVVVYNAYTWRMEEGEKKQRNAREVRKVVKTWVIGEQEPEKEGYEPVLIPPKDDDAEGGGDADSTLRRRTAATK